MIIKKITENVPEFGILNDNENAITTEVPYVIFKKQRNFKGAIILDVSCCCEDSDCKNKITLYYNGLDRYTASKRFGGDTVVRVFFQSQRNDQDDRGGSSNIFWSPSIENVDQFISFSETAREAILFKKELLKDLYAELNVRINDDEILIIVRKEENEIRFILFEIPITYPKVPLLSESKDYFECLGVIGTLSANNIDTSKIKIGSADMDDPFFEPVISWVKLLAEENKLDLKIRNISVMLV